MIRVDDSRVYEALAEYADVVDLGDIGAAILGAVSDARVIGGEDIEEEDAERRGRLVFAVEKEGATT